MDWSSRNFNEERWSSLPYKIKVAIFCRLDPFPYFSNAKKSLNLTNTEIYNAFDHWIDMGAIKTYWDESEDGESWVLMHVYDDHCTNGWIDKVIEELRVKG
jgi:hypothetical protein